MTIVSRNQTAFIPDIGVEERARRIFGDARIDSLPKYVRGPHKGKPKGILSWTMNKKKIVEESLYESVIVKFVELPESNHVLFELYSNENGIGKGRVMFDSGEITFNRECLLGERSDLELMIEEMDDHAFTSTHSTEKEMGINEIMARIKEIDIELEKL